MQNTNLSNLQNKTHEELVQIAEALKLYSDKKKYNKIDFVFPDEGQFSRDKYPKQLQFFKAGSNHKIRAFIGGNGTGKSWSGGTEWYYHVSGKYPSWWEGCRFNRPIRTWICARENKQLKEAIQEILFGKFDDKGTGIIPKEDLLDEKGQIQTWAMSGTANCIGTALIRHYNTSGEFDGFSQVDFKTYAQGWQEFQGSTRDLIWLDEEPDDPKIYSECLARTRGPKGKEGILYCTFTPLLGYSTIYLSFLPNGQTPKDGIHPNNPNKYVVLASWDDVPHLSESWKVSQIEEYKLADPNSIEARTKGIAAMGSGRIFPIDEEFVVVSPFEIPEYWPRAFGMDFGYHATAAVWVVQDPQTKIKYVYSTYKRGKVINALHAESIKSKGSWIPGIGDPSGGGRMEDGRMYIDHYRTMGLKLSPGVNTFAPSIGSLLTQFETGALKIFKTCEDLINEVRTYRYDMNNPNIAAKNQEDHLIDALRYVDSRFNSFAISESDHDNWESGDVVTPQSNRDNLTGY